MLRSTSLLLLAAVALAAEQSAGTYTVSFDKKLLPDPVSEVAQLDPVPGLPDGLHAFATTIPLRKDVRVRVAVLERDGAKPVWMIDKNLDGELSPDEQVDVGDTPTVVEFPLSGEPFPSFPLQVKAVQLPPAWQADMLRRNVRILYYSHAVDISGKATLDGVPYNFFYRVSSNTFDVDLKKTWTAIDINHDGKIDLERWSDEMAYAMGEPVVFKVGSHYLRTDAIDMKALTATVREVEASEYRLISMRAGRMLPDFSFVGLEGGSHSLKRDRGARYTMLYFWATWCAICQSEMGLIEEANRKYHDKGLQIIGINGDKDAAAARKFIKDRNVTFPQASWDSVKDLVEQRFRIDEWPTAIMIDSDQRVVSTNSKGQPHIRQEGLMSTLEGLLVKGLTPAEVSGDDEFRPPTARH